jgi:chitinase
MKRSTRVSVLAIVCLSLYVHMFWTSTSYAQSSTAKAANGAGQRIVGYFTQWGIYSGYSVKNLVTSGSASKMTVVNYAFGNINAQNLQCFEVNQAGQGDAWADYQRPVGASESVDGVADVNNQPLRGNFNQLRKLKLLYPNLKVMISLGGWTWSAHFSDAALTAQSRKTFVQSCLNQYILGNLPQLAGDSAGGPGAAANVFDGIDIDWEYPASPGNVGNVYRPVDTKNFTLLLAEFRKQLDALGKQTGKHYLLSIAAPAGEAHYSKIQLNKIGQYLDWINLMTYDYHGPWEPNGPTNFNAPLYGSPNDPSPTHENINRSINAYLQAGIQPRQLVMGVPFYGHGWTNVPNVNNGLYQGDTNTQPAPGIGAGTNNYNVLKNLSGFTAYRDPVTKAFWIFDGVTFWSYDDPQSLLTKMHYVYENNLGGAMIWSMDGDDATGTLISAIYTGLHQGG